jgi:ribonuclease HI
MNIATDGSGNVMLGKAGCGIIIPGQKPYHAKVPPVVITDLTFSVADVGDYQLITAQCEGPYCKPTNNRAELLAIYFAVVLAPEGKIKIYTDSKYCLHIITGGFIRGLTDQQILAKKNGDIILLTKKAILARPSQSRFLKVKAHQTFISRLDGVERELAELNILADKYSRYDL